MALYGQMNETMQAILGQVMQHQDLLKFLYYTTNDLNVEEASDLSDAQRVQVKRENVYGYRKLPLNNQSEMKPYLCMEYGSKTYHMEQNKFFNGNEVVFYIFCEGSLDPTQNGSRVLAIEACLRALFDGGQVEAIGKSKLKYSEPLGIQNTNLVGRRVSVIFYDFEQD
ncbi:MAG: hypothetical protein RR817_11340 [Niameybacter sp.]